MGKKNQAWANKILVNPCKKYWVSFPFSLSYCFLHLFRAFLKMIIWDDNLYSGLASEFSYSVWNCLISVCILQTYVWKKSANCLFHILFNVSDEPFAGFDIVEVVSANRYFIVLSQLSKNSLWLLYAILQSVFS